MVFGTADLVLRAAPLADARAAGVGQHRAVDGLQRLHLAVALDRGAHLLGARRDQERHRGLDAVRLRLLGHVRRRGSCPRRRSWCSCRSARVEIASTNSLLGSCHFAPARRGDRAAPGRASAGRRRAARASTGRSRTHAVVVVLGMGFDLGIGARGGGVFARPAAPARRGRSRAGTSPCARRRGRSRWWRRARRPCW